MGSAPVACARRQAGDLPQPDAYLLRAERLGLAPYDCVLVEDAPAGILSGLAAGCQVIAVNAPKLEQVDLLRSSQEQIAISGREQGAAIRW